MNAQTNGGDPTPKKNQFKCIVPGCRSSTSTNIAKLHSFPWRDMPRAKKWIVAVGCLQYLGAPPKALLRLRVCDLHFDKKLKRGKNMKLWDHSAVPTLKLDAVKKSKTTKKLPRKRIQKKMETEVDDDPVEPIAELSTSETLGNGTLTSEAPGDGTLTSEAPGDGTLTSEAPGDGTLTSEAPGDGTLTSETPGNGTPTSETPGDGTPTPIRLPRELARFLTLREKLREKNTARKGYDRSFSVFAADLYVSCPEAYRVLWRSLRLPPPALLARVDLGVGTRLDCELMRCFEAKMGRLAPGDRECVLCLDEVELTQKLFYAIDKDEIVGFEEIEGELRVAPAARALVLAARGLRAPWTQPLGYFLLAEDTPARRLAAPLRRLVVHALYGRARCPVRAVLAGLGPTFAELAHALGVTVESPFVLEAAPRRRVCFLHDPAQLLLTLRDTLIAYDIRFRDPDDGAELRASWRDVERLHREDSARAPRLLPELTRARVAPSPRESLQERHAAALFTRRVAAQLAAGGTARLVRLAADARRALRAPRPRGLARVAAAAAALTAALRDMRIVSPDGAEHDAEVFVRALRVTFAGALHLLAEAEGAERDAPLPLARCGLRPLRRFVERAEGARGRVEPGELRRRFRRWATRRLLAPAPAAAAADDLAALLRRAERERSPPPPPRALALGSLRHRADVRRGEAAAAAALVREARRAHGCAAFVRWAREPARGVRLLRALDAAFKRALAGRGRNAPGARALAAAAECLATRSPCACFPRDTFGRLFVRFRLRAALQTYNRALRGAPAPDSARWLFR